MDPRGGSPKSGAARLIHSDARFIPLARVRRISSSPTKTGRVTIAGHSSDDLAPDPCKNPEAGGAQRVVMHRFLIVVEGAGDNISAHSPDLPGAPRPVRW